MGESRGGCAIDESSAWRQIRPCGVQGGLPFLQDQDWIISQATWAARPQWSTDFQVLLSAWLHWSTEFYLSNWKCARENTPLKRVNRGRAAQFCLIAPKDFIPFSGTIKSNAITVIEVNEMFLEMKDLSRHTMKWVRWAFSWVISTNIQGICFALGFDVINLQETSFSNHIITMNVHVSKHESSHAKRRYSFISALQLLKLHWLTQLPFISIKGFWCYK